MGENLPAVTESLDTLTTEIHLLQEHAEDHITQIGARLLKAKKLVPHGEWLAYIESQLNFTPRWAQFCMKAAEAFGTNTKPVSHLGPSKVILLLDAPEDDREALTAEAGGLTKRQLDAKVKELNETKRQMAELERRLKTAVQEAEAAKSRPAQVIEKPGRTVFAPDPRQQAYIDQLRKENAEKDQAIAQQAKDLTKIQKWYDETRKDLERFRGEVDKDYTLGEKIIEREARLAALDGLIQQMQAQFEDGKRNRRGGAELLHTVYPLDRIIYGIARDVRDLREQGVGGPCDEESIAKLRTKLREVANDLDAILKDRKTIVLTADVEVLKVE